MVERLTFLLDFLSLFRIIVWDGLFKLLFLLVPAIVYSDSISVGSLINFKPIWSLPLSNSFSHSIFGFQFLMLLEFFLTIWQLFRVPRCNLVANYFPKWVVVSWQEEWKSRRLIIALFPTIEDYSFFRFYLTEVGTPEVLYAKFTSPHFVWRDYLWGV